MKYLGKTLAFAALAWAGAAAAQFAPGEKVIVLNSGDGSVSIVDPVTRTEEKRIPVGKEPHHLMATPDNKELIVASAASNDLVFLDPNSGEIVRRISGISDPYQIGYSPDRKWFVAASNRLDRVDIYHAGTFQLAKRLELPKVPSHIAFSADSRIAFVTLQEADKFVAIDLAKQEVLWEMPTGRQPAGIWMTPDDRYLLVAITGESHVEAYDWRARRQVKRIFTGLGAHNFVALGDGRHVFLSNRMGNSISLLDQQSLAVKETFPVPGGPDCMEITKDGKQLWTTSRWIRKVTVVDLATKQVLFQIPVGRSPHGLFFLSHAPRQ